MTEPNELGHLPIGEVLPGMTLMPLPEGEVAETVYVLIKTRDADGSTTGWSWRSPEIVNHEELLGALISQSDLLRHQMLSDWDDAE